MAEFFPDAAELAPLCVEFCRARGFDAWTDLLLATYSTLARDARLDVDLVRGAVHQAATGAAATPPRVAPAGESPVPALSPSVLSELLASAPPSALCASLAAVLQDLCPAHTASFADAFDLMLRDRIAVGAIHPETMPCHRSVGV